MLKRRRFGSDPGDHSQTMAAVVIALVFLTFTGIPTGMAVHAYGVSRAVAARGVAAVGYVESQYRTESRYGATLHLGYAFRTPSGRTYDGHDVLEPDQAKQVVTGGRVRILFDRANPAVSMIAANQKRMTFVLWYAGVFDVIALTFATAIVLAIRAAGRRKPASP